VSKGEAMRFTPILIVYVIIMLIAATAMRQLNKCTEERREHDKKYHSK